MDGLEARQVDRDRGPVGVWDDFADPLRGGLAPFVVSAGEHDARALTRELEDQRKAQATGRTGYDGGFAGQIADLVGPPPHRSFSNFDRRCSDGRAVAASLP